MYYLSIFYIEKPPKKLIKFKYFPATSSRFREGTVIKIFKDVKIKTVRGEVIATKNKIDKMYEALVNQFIA